MPDLLQGPPYALPRRLDRAADRWARLPPRLRAAVLLLLLLAAAGLQGVHAADLQARWGGPGQPVWRATRTLPAGQPVRGALVQVTLPAGALPAEAVTGPVPRGASLALPLVEGAVLTRVHLDPVGPAAAIGPDERLVPIPVDRDAGVEAGSVVDVWPVVDGRSPPEPLATARPVVAVQAEGGRPVALVSLPSADVAGATAALSRGRLLLAIRPGG